MLAQRALDAYNLYGKVKDIYGYYSLVMEAAHEATRPSALLKLGVDGLMTVASKAVGASLTSHPYFAYHKAHIEVMAQALNASANRDAAVQALDQAIRSADAAQALRNMLADYEGLKNGLKLVYTMLLKDSLTTLKNPNSAQSQKALKESNNTPEKLRQFVDGSVYEWRAKWCELYLDGTGLLAMAQVEYRATEAAMARYNDMLKSMEKGGAMGKIASYSTQQDRKWKELDRARDPQKGAAGAVSDPTSHARKQMDAIETVVRRLARSCDVVMSPAAYDPDTIVSKIGSL